MNKPLAATFFSLALTALPAIASAQPCPPGSWFCAGVSVNAGVQYVPAPPPPPPQPVYVVQQPVYYQPAPVVVTTVPTYTTYTTTTVSYLGVGRNRAFGLGGFAAGLAFGRSGHRDDTSGMGGAGVTMRFRHHPYLATELSLSAMFGRDYNYDSRAEVPLSINEIVYFNPMHRFQLYALIGVGGSWAGVQYDDANARARGRDSATYGYFGGQVGLGAEWQLSPHFSIYGDARAFLRTRIDREVDSNPEFTRTGSDGRTETTNVSTGVVGQVGGIFYF